jgi:hypothetical protein
VMLFLPQGIMSLGRKGLMPRLFPFFFESGQHRQRR